MILIPAGESPEHRAHPRTADTAVVAIVTLAPDDTTRLGNEAATRHHADQDHGFVVVVDSAIGPVITKRPDGTITTWNRAAERLYGYTAAETVGVNIDIIIPPDRRQEHLTVIDRVLAGQPVDSFETVRVAKDGRRIDVAISISAIRSPSGELIGIVKTTRDMAEHQAAEEKFHLAVEACPNGMIMSDKAGNIVMVNSEVERLFGYRREELVGRSIDILLPERLRRQHVHHRKAFHRDPGPRRQMAGRELIGLRKDGTELPIEVGLNPIQTAGGLLILSAIVDVSERKRLDRLKDEFVSMVSHELRTPLTSIYGALGLLMGNAAGALPDTALRLLAIAHTNSQRLVRLINDILDLQKIEAGQVVFHLKHLDLRALITQTIDANRAFAQGFGVRIRLDDASVDGEVFADADRLAQIVTNLLSNAVKFSPGGDEVVVAIERRGENMRISVRDHGPGIPEEFKSRIFQKFAQADSSDARQKGGTGLGLSIVKQLIHQHGGTVGFEPAPGGGTSFHVELPFSSDPSAHDRVPHLGATGAPLLLCDSDDAASALLATSLRLAGFAVETASTAAGACAQAAETPYAALLIGLQLPDLDGLHLIRRLRALPRHADTPIIVVSIDPAQRRPDLRSGALPVCDWLDKPADRGELVRVVHRAIAGIEIARPRVLHHEPDADLGHLVREALRPHADVISAESVDAARRVLASLDFDMVVLDLTCVDDADLGVLAELRNHDGHAVPALLFSGDADPALAQRVSAALAGSRMSVDKIVGTVRLFIAKHNVQPRAETEAA